MTLKGNELKNLKETTNLLRSELKKNGWCFVLLSRIGQNAKKFTLLLFRILRIGRGSEKKIFALGRTDLGICGSVRILKGESCRFSKNVGPFIETSNTRQGQRRNSRVHRLHIPWVIRMKI